MENALNTTVEIYDSFGKRVFVEEVYNSSSIDTSHLSSGLYIMKIEK
ncbi:MAG: T9SS type A sorting domain-containing protein [Bacteroidetes bacterium]|nr:T9SS type A sorting domain-containing protein [Bacteroidota bacterium]